MFGNKKDKTYPKLQAGDVVFFEPADFMGQIIRVFTLSKYSHAGIMVDSENMMEAQTSGVRIVPISEALNRTQSKDAYTLTANARENFKPEALKAFVADVNGRPYDFYQAFISGLHGIDRNIKTRESEKKFFCSELVADGLYHAGVLADTNSSVVNPHRLYDMLRKQNII